MWYFIVSIPDLCTLTYFAEIQKVRGDCLLISSLPGKALRTLFDIARLAEICRLLDECLLISSLPGIQCFRLYYGFVNCTTCKRVQHFLQKYSAISQTEICSL